MPALVIRALQQSPCLCSEMTVGLHTACNDRKQMFGTWTQSRKAVLPAAALSLTSLGNRWCLRTMLSCTLFSHWHSSCTPASIMWQGHIWGWSDPNSDLPLERTVFENRGWGERQGRVSYKCHIQQLLCFQWHLNWNRHAQQGTGFKIFFPYFRKTIMLKPECLLVCQCVEQQNSNGMCSPTS